MEAKYQQAIYSIGAEWAKTRPLDLTRFSADYDRFKAWMSKLLDGDFFLPEEVFISVRVYNQYKRYPEEARRAFIVGVWDALHGSTENRLPLPTL
jgi:hypothetical protein